MGGVALGPLGLLTQNRKKKKKTRNLLSPLQETANSKHDLMGKLTEFSKCIL